MLDAVGAHLSNAQIAGRLHISVRTVESHVSSLLRKFGAADRRELAGACSCRGAPAAAVGLPAPQTSFVGREEEQVAVLAALREARLVTLVGPGGVGKTRLAVEVARGAASLLPSGCAFADLVPAREGFVVQAVASALGVSERPRQPLAEAVLEHLGGAAVAAGARQLRAPSRRGGRVHRAAAGGLPWREGAGDQPRAAGGHRGADGDGACRCPSLRAWRTAGPVPRPRCCLSTGPLPSTATSSRVPRSMSCAPGLRACRWRSSWRRPAAHRWDWTACSPAWTITCGFWRAAGALIHGTARSGGHRLEPRSAR